jgi:hypothetical protein
LLQPGNNKGGSITVQLTSCLAGLDESVLQIKTKIVSCHTADSKPVKQEFNGTVILPTLVFPASASPFFIIVTKFSVEFRRFIKTDIFIHQFNKTRSNIFYTSRAVFKKTSFSF